MKANAPIGVFDSGLGGLTAVRELQSILPGEDLVYFGDTGRVPYGTRGTDTIIAYTRQDIAFLLSKGVKTVLAACGTVSSTFPPDMAAALPVSYMGVVQPTAAAAVAATQNGKIGIIGTEATVASGSYQAALAALLPGVQTVQAACPLFVPLVENGHFARGDEMALLACQEYLGPIKAAGVDTLIMGCTHYPLLADTVSDYFGGALRLIDPGREAALALRQSLASQSLLNPRQSGGGFTAFVSDAPARFAQLTGIFLGRGDVEARHIDIEKYDLRWIQKGYLPGVD